MRLLTAAPLALCLFAAAQIAWAQAGAAAAKQPPQPPSSAPAIQVYSRETLVDVTVIDGDGRPVHGLAKSDFTIQEDNNPQSIRSFQEFSKDTLTPAPAPPNLPPNVYTNLQPATGPLNVLLFDDINGGDIAQARLEAAKFIKSMAPGTRVALLALGDTLTVLQGPTSDPAQLLKMVNAYVKPYLVEPVGCTRTVLLDWATIDQLRQLATYLSGIKGKKNVIWIGNGIPDMIWGGCQDWKLRLQQTYDLLGDAQATLYPLDPHGVGGLGQRQLAMEAVAESTGGAAYYENNDLKSLIANAVDAGSSYYAISYVPPSLAYDGRYHTIKITVDRPGLHLVYRKGYSAEDPTQIEHPPATALGAKVREKQPSGPAPDPLTAAMSPSAPPATQLQFNVRVEPSTEPESPFDPPVMGALNPKLKKEPLARYGLLYMVPQSQITFADAGGGAYIGSLEFDVAAFYPDGELITLRSQTMKLPLTTDEYRQFIATPFQFFLQLDLPPGHFSLRVGILDGASNKVGTVDVPMTVGNVAKLPPLAPEKTRK